MNGDRTIRASRAAALVAALALTASSARAAPASSPPPSESSPPDEHDDADIDHSSAWDSPAAPSSPSPQPHPIEAPQPPVQPPDATADGITDPEIETKMRSAKGMAIGGYVCLGLGAGTLLLVSTPFWIASHVARDRAGNNPLLASEQELLERADRRIHVARISALAGGSVLLVGVILVAAGLGWRASLRREKRDLAIVPAVGLTNGLQMSFRF